MLLLKRKFGRVEKAGLRGKIMNAAIIEYLSSVSFLSVALKDELGKLVLREDYKPHQVIHAAGHTENRFWFIEKGFARTYYLDSSGKEHTLSFYPENNIIWSNQGYWNEPTDYYLEVLEPSVTLSVTYKMLHNLNDVYPETTGLVQLLIRQQYHQDLLKSRLLGLTAEERYQQVRKSMPELFRRSSVRLIASYLNMTRENLSRLMGRDL
jgi:CRP-like cAMP-binding protein